MGPIVNGIPSAFWKILTRPNPGMDAVVEKILNEPLFPKRTFSLGDVLDAQGQLLRSPIPTLEQRSYDPSPAIEEVLFPRKIEW